MKIPGYKLQATSYKLPKWLVFAFLIVITLVGCEDSGQLDQANKTRVVSDTFQLADDQVVINEAGLKTDALEAPVAKFKPEVKLKRWGEETYLKVWTDEAGDDFAKKVDNKIIWETPDKTYRLYDLPADGLNERGAFEYEVILKNKPVSNILNLNIESQGLTFYYQPNVSPEEMAKLMGDSEVDYPENVRGSYAVYHESKSGHQLGQTDYQTGKAFHIYRPRLTDVSGRAVWADFNDDAQTSGHLTIIMPQDFLEQAVYPVTIDPTFGQTSCGVGSSANKNQAIVLEFGKLEPQGVNVSITSSFVCGRTITDNGGTQVKTAIYEGDSVLATADKVLESPSPVTVHNILPHRYRAQQLASALGRCTPGHIILYSGPGGFYFPGQP